MFVLSLYLCGVLTHKDTKNMEKSLQTDEKYMRMAIIEAQKAFDSDEVPIGAVIVAGGRVIARGHNLVETLTDVTAHAEMQAITAAASAAGGKYLQNCTSM